MFLMKMFVELFQEYVLEEVEEDIFQEAVLYVNVPEVGGDISDEAIEEDIPGKAFEEVDEVDGGKEVSLI